MEKTPSSPGLNEVFTDAKIKRSKYNRPHGRAYSPPRLLTPLTIF